MVPDFIQHPKLNYGILPPGHHTCTINEIEARFGNQNEQRTRLVQHLKTIIAVARRCAVERIFIGGGFSTGKQYPTDLDIFFVTRFEARPADQPKECEAIFDPPTCKDRYCADSLSAPATSTILGTLVGVFAVCKQTLVERGILELSIT